MDAATRHATGGGGVRESDDVAGRAISDTRGLGCHGPSAVRRRGTRRPRDPENQSRRHEK